MAKVLYIAEGEIEGRFINFLKQADLIQTGRFKKFNLMQNQLKDSSNILTQKFDDIYCILDTDLAAPDNIDNLVFNLKKLAGLHPKSVFCLVQNKNFEDELKFLLDCGDLGKFFKLPHNTTKDLKTYLAQSVNYEKFISKENLIRYCSRFENFAEKVKFASQIRIVSVEKCML